MTLARLLALSALAACTEPTEDARALPVDAAPGGLSLVVSDVRLGSGVDLSVSGAPANATIYVARSLAGAGPGSCPSFLGGECFSVLDPAELHTSMRAGAAGNASRSTFVPAYPAFDGRTVCFEAVVPRPGGALMSGPVCVDIGFDTDGDKVIDAEDQCPGFDDANDWDGDFVPDDCDPGGAPPEFNTATFNGSLETYTFQNRTVRQIIPPNPVGVVWLFHGSGGSSELAEAPDSIFYLNEFLDRGYGFVAVDSDNQSTGVFNDNVAPASNGDWARVNALRTQLRTQGRITNGTPMFVVGFSAGGEFASYMTHVAPANGWPLRAASFHAISGRSTFYGAPADLPAVFVAPVNDQTFDPATVQQRYTEHLNAGNPALFLAQTEERLAPTRFAVSPNVFQSTSRDMWDVVVDNGYFDRQGYLLSPTNDVRGLIDEIAAVPGFTPFRPGKAVLSSVLSTHAFIYRRVDEAADFFDAQL